MESCWCLLAFTRLLHSWCHLTPLAWAVLLGAPDFWAQERLLNSRALHHLWCWHVSLERHSSPAGGGSSQGQEIMNWVENTSVLEVSICVRGLSYEKIHSTKNAAVVEYFLFKPLLFWSPSLRIILFIFMSDFTPGYWSNYLRLKTAFLSMKYWRNN